MAALAVWTWAGVVHLTRVGAVYAATHCAIDGTGSNVVSYMQAHLPPMVDPGQLINGPAVITVQYLTQDSVNNVTSPAQCLPGCTLDCAPDAVSVTVSGYQFTSFLAVLSPIAMPSFSTTMQIESGGGNPDNVNPLVLTP